MSKTEKIPYNKAIVTANHLIDTLRPYCDRIELAGSLRRRRPMIGDIEIVALPRPILDLIGDPIKPQKNQPSTLLDLFLINKGVNLAKDGPKMKQFKYGRYTVDLFLPETPDHWGCIYLIRTGSVQFSKWLMTDAQHQAGLRFVDGRLHSIGTPLNTPEEEDVFTALNLPWISPTMRDDHKWLEVVNT